MTPGEARAAWERLAPIACWHIRCTNLKAHGSNYCIRRTFGEDRALPEHERALKAAYNQYVREHPLGEIKADD